jgi:ATP-dependent DNA helicase RecQ
MGVNKPDIGWVVHYDLPESLESYLQESGRAARHANLVADAVLLYTKNDLHRRRSQLRNGALTFDLNMAQRLLDEIAGAPMRGRHHVVDPDRLCEAAGVEPDDLGVFVAWLERSGNVIRHRDAALRGHVTVGLREPEDRNEARLFYDLLKVKLQARAGVRRQIRLDEVAGEDPEELESLLIDWTLRGLITFQITRRAWRFELLDRALHRDRFLDALASWKQEQVRQLEDMIAYATTSACRRQVIASVFADPPTSCGASLGVLACDNCVDAPPQWYSVPLALVPAPEELVDVEAEVLKLVAWASESDRVRYGEATLKAILRGDEQVRPGQPIGRGALSAPQFGALRYLRNRDGRIKEAIEKLIANGDVQRVEAQHEGRSYWSLVITDQALWRLGRVRRVRSG